MPNSKSPKNLPENLQNLLKIASADLDYAIGEEAIRRAELFLRGIRVYQNHPTLRSIPATHILWQQGTTRLRDYNPSAKPIILVIPSLINRFDVMDMETGSFLRALATADYRPLVVDWDAPGDSEKQFGFDDYVKRLVAITDWIKVTYPNTTVHLLGYCMGGLLALALAAHKPDFKSILLLATPWDFHQPNPETGLMLGQFADNWRDYLKITGHMSVDLIQYLFALLQPFQSLNKFIDFAEEDPASAEAYHFVLLEDWLNDGVPLPLKVAHECLKGWYGQNQTARLQWKILGQVIDPAQIKLPSYVVVPGRDYIVPPESARPLAKLLPNATLHEPMTGHIGMMASRHAQQLVWQPLLQWFEKNNELS